MRDQCVELAIRLGRDPEEVIEWWAERAAIREVDGGQSREDAEREAFDEVRDMLEHRKGPRSTLPAPVAIKKREESS